MTEYVLSTRLKHPMSLSGSLADQGPGLLTGECDVDRMMDVMSLAMDGQANRTDP